MHALIELVIPAYLYTQYNDDPNIVAFFTGYSALAQGCLDYLNALNLPCWISSFITGELLDWIALGIYGEGLPLLQIPENALRSLTMAMAWDKGTILIKRFIRYSILARKPLSSILTV
ncbi:hypothetical protein [Erwinia amylovora]|uniref:hypothetical protein n=1 Tax=Erwinia amylovora TaxID=552 RepID=UPI00144429EB|nr:hypothetical protein [Erwinia amylovora]